MSEEIERIIKECSGVDTFDYVITPQQRDTMRLAEYIKELQQENRQLKEKIKWYEKENKHNQEIIIKDTKVLDEIREQLKKIKPNLDFEPWSVYKVSGDNLFDLLQILDKVKE